MREIKFRAWDKQRKDMLYQLKKAPCFGLNENDRACSIEDVLHYYKNDFELMQYAGLKDSRGKEIYEGDLMMWMSQDTDNSIMQGLYEIIFKDGSYMAKNCKGFSPLYEDLKRFLVVRDDEILEVVGNIYEHYHLLNDKA